jgi:hypothetical protein
VLGLPRLAREDEAETLIPLFCSGGEEIGLKAHVCSSEKRPELLKWLKQQCNKSLVRVITDNGTPVGMLVLDSSRAWNVILYIVVDRRLRGKKTIGPALVRDLQSQPDIASLRAEARNEHSKRLFARCGFWQHDESDRGHPIMTWERTTV